MNYTWDVVTGPHEIGHTAGLKHPYDDYKSSVFDIFDWFTTYGPTYNAPKTNFMRGIDAYPYTGPTKEQMERIYRLYKAGKLNSKHKQPVTEE
jgi:hypothetical protein